MVLLGARSGQSLRSQGYTYVSIREQCLGTQWGSQETGCQGSLGYRAQRPNATDMGTQGTVPSSTDLESRNQEGRV